MADPDVPYVPLDKFAHGVGYAGLAVILAVVLLRWWSLGRVVLVTSAVLAVYAVIDEYTQQWVGRVMDPWDLLADGVGVGMGLLLVWGWLQSVGGAGVGQIAIEEAPLGGAGGAGGGLVRQSVLVSGLTMVSRVLGLVRDVVLGAVFGKGVVLDAFLIGFMVPNLFRRLFGEGALTAAFLPRYRRMLDDDPELAKRYASAVILLVSSAVSLAVLVGEVALLWLWWGVDVSKWSLAIQLTAIMLPYAPMVCVVAFLGTVLQARGRFAPAALAPIELNVGMIAVAALAAWWSESLVTMAAVQAVGVLVCGALQLVVLWRVFAGRGVLSSVVSLARRASKKPSSVLSGAGEHVRATLWTMLPMVLGLGVFQVNTLLDGLIAFGLSAPPGALPGERFTALGWSLEYPLHTGAVTTLTFAQRLYQFPLGVFGIAIATVIFPALSALGRAGQREAFGVLLRRGLGLTVFIALPASVGLVMSAGPLTRVVFEHGAFTEEDAQRVAWVLLGYGSAVWAYSMTHVLARAFYARDDAQTPLRVSLCMVLLNVVLNLTLIWPMGAAGLAWATASSAVVQVVVLLWLVRRHVDRAIDGRLLRSMGKVIVSSAAMAAVLAWVLWCVPPAALNWTGSAALLVVLVAMGGAVYAASAMMLRCDEVLGTATR